MLEVLLAVSITLAAAVWLTFCVWYTVRASWWKGPIGRNQFGVAAVLAVILIRLAIVTWLSLTPGVLWLTIVGLIAYTLAAAYGIQRTVFMERAQREKD